MEYRKRQALTTWLIHILLCFIVLVCVFPIL